ncbi:MAG: hypothetical protein CM15mL4_2950 [uncultured marine virus]|nr:MAG: hypothetical protein CM15mL4_2950 [uncultured marine virus]
MEDMILKVPCPCCIEEDGESDTLVLLGDDQQNIAVLGLWVWFKQQYERTY